MSYEQRSPKGLSRLQRVAFTLMTSLVLLTFVGTNLHTLLWQSSDWLVSTILPATVVDLTNQERATNAAPPLRRSALLDQAAAQKAEHMVREGYFAHFSPDGVSPWHWFGEVGYRYAHAGENLAVHFTDSSAMVDAWMQSPTHRENIVNAQYTEIGIGTATGTFEGYRTVFVVQLFATPAAPAASATTEAGATTRASQPATPQPAPTEPATLPETDPVASVTPPTPTPTPTPAPIALAENIESTDGAPLAPDPSAAVDTTDSTEVVLTADRSSSSTAAPEKVFRTDGDMVRIETSLIATSSGLAVAQVREPQAPSHAGATVTALLTQPNKLLERTYVVLATIVVLLLGYSIALETRRLHYRQVAYGCLLLLGMVGLWFLHATLTNGAVVV